jgi:hypothetical protein
MLNQLRHIGTLLLVSTLALPTALSGQSAQAVEEILQTSVALTGDAAVLDLELASGRSLQIMFNDGLVLIDGDVVGRYALGSNWAEFSGAEYRSADVAAAETIRAALEPLAAGMSAELAEEARVEAAAAIEEAAVAEGAAAAALEAAVQVQAEVLEGLAQDEVIAGGLVVELSEVKGLARQLMRIGLAPELERLLNGDLEMPVRIVIEADEYRLAEGAELDKMLLLVESDAVLAGKVRSNVLVADGSLLILPTAVIDGDVIAIDATVTNQGGTIAGTIRESLHRTPVVVAPAIPRVRIGRHAPSALGRVTAGLGSLARTVAMYLLFGFLGALIVYLFRGHLETVSDTVSFSFGRSFLAGLAAEVLFLPIGLVMTVLIVTAIAVPFYIIAFALLSLLGYVSVAHAAGENLTRRRFSWTDRMRRANSYYYVLNGLGVLLALFVGAAITQMAYPLLGWAHDLLIASAWILTWIAATSGLGAAVLSRAGTRRTYARPHELPELPSDTLAEEMAPSAGAAGARRRAREESDEK